MSYEPRGTPPLEKALEQLRELEEFRKADHLMQLIPYDYSYAGVVCSGSQTIEVSIPFPDRNDSGN